MPIPVIIALIANAIFILIRFVLVANFLHLLSIQNIPILIATVAVHVVGVIGILLRKKWSRRYTYWLFGVYLVIHVLSINELLKEFDPLGITWSVIAIGISLYVFHQFYTGPAVQKYLTN
jgi:threonine/homoserine efflux transporter RhtA